MTLDTLHTSTERTIFMKPDHRTSMDYYAPYGSLNDTNDTYMNHDSFDGGLNYREFQIYWLNSDEKAAIDLIKLYVSPVLLVLGAVGNIISYLVLRHKLSKQRSVLFYMALYAITNTLNLYVACGLDWVSHITGTKYIANLTDWLCRIWKFLFSVMHYTSTWLVVLMVFDRFIYLCIPSKAHSLCSVFTAKVLSCFVVVILIVISIHAMWTYELVELEDKQCVVDLKRDDFQTNVWPIISAVIYSYLPIMLIIIFDILIVVNLVILNARQYQGRNYSPLQQQLTRVVLVISVTFLILTLPAIILNIIDYFNSNLFNTYESISRLYLGNFICTLLMWLLCAINFPQYFIPLPLLRNELRTWISKPRCGKTGVSDKSNGIEANGRLLMHDNGAVHEPNAKGMKMVTKL